MIIRPLQKSDYPQWLTLWNGNCDNKVPLKTTTKTWQWICAEDSGVGGIGLFDDTGTLLGITHYILHKSTGNDTDAALMQDLYVSPKHRGLGYASLLVRELAEIGKEESWCRLYWLADENNDAAQKLYQKIGVKLAFSLHVMPI